MMHWQACRWLVCWLVVMPLMATAAKVTKMSTVTVTVTVEVPPPCVINGNRKIEVEFGDVMTTKVDGKNYRRQVDYSLSCTGAVSNFLKLQIAGVGAIDNTVLKTSKAGLGIELQQGTSKLAVNRWLNFTYPEKPELWAVPVKDGSIPLKGGKFMAAATMKVEYP